MSEIKKGDWVIVIKSCCAECVGPSRVFIVDDLDENTGDEECAFCKTDSPIGREAGCDGWYFHISWLRKLDPPASGELSGVPLRLKEPV